MQHPTLQKLKIQREQLNARILKVENSQKSKDKKNDTRRKILVGAYYLDKIKQEGNFDELKQALDRFLTRNSDRVLFELSLNEEAK